MKKVRNHSSLLSKYSLMYEKNSRSRVFAPLAETYRKLGMIDESMKILKDGIKFHPSYTLGYIVLANCYYDLQNYEMSYNSIRPFVSQNLENITLQKLFAKTCINLGYLEEALQTFKCLLLINPKDTNVADQVKLLEDDLLVNEENEEEIETHNNASSFNEDEWVQVDFNKVQRDLSETNLDINPEKVSETEEDDIEDWNVSNKSPLESFKNEIQQNNIELKHLNLDDEFYREDYDNEAKDVILPGEQASKELIKKSEEPIITHTLVDLYIQQGHYEQAASILQDILELHPNDTPTKNRLDEITLKMVEGVMNSPDEIERDEAQAIEVFEANEEDSSESSEEENLHFKALEKIFSKYLVRLNEESERRLSE